jgi:hypothetical protein
MSPFSEAFFSEPLVTRPTSSGGYLLDFLQPHGLCLLTCRLVAGLSDGQGNLVFDWVRNSFPIDSRRMAVAIGSCGVGMVSLWLDVHSPLSWIVFIVEDRY